MSTPRLRAACSSGVPTGKFPRLPEGVNTTSGSRVAMRYALSLSRPSAVAAFAPPARRFGGGARGRGGRCRARAGTGRRVAEAANPARAIGIMTQHDVRTHDGLDDFDVHGIGDEIGRASCRERV